MRQSGRRAAIYARYSTDLQSDRSIDDQVALCRDHARGQGLTVVETYSDRARTSASILGRDGLLRLMEDARAGRFDLVLVEALDRISRDQEDLAGVYKRLTFAGIDMVAVHDGKADAIQIGIRGLVGELFLRDLKQKVRRGMRGVVRDGRHAGGRAYGYRPIPGRPGELEIVEDEAEVVRRIFAAYLGGQSPRQIAGALNAEGVLPPRGVRWNASTINGNAARGHGILLNPLYSGQIVWNRVTMVRDPETGRRISRANPEAEWQTAEAPRLAIVAPEVWAAVQIRKGERSHLHETRRDQPPRRPFSGLLRCGKCGGGMAIHDRAGAAVRIHCSTARESGACDNRGRYRLDRIEAAIVDRLRGQLTHPELLREYLRAYRAERRASIDAATRTRAALERELATLSARLRRQVDLYSRGVIDDETGIADIQRQVRAAKAALEEAGAAVPVVDLHPEAVARFSDTLDRLAAQLAAPVPRIDPEVTASLRKIVASIIVHPPGDGTTATVDVICWLAAITGDEIAELGGLVVAEEGLEPPTRGL